MANAHHGTDFVHAIAAGVHHYVAVNVATLCVNGPSVVEPLRQSNDWHVAMDFGTDAACPTGQSLAKRGRIDVAIERIPPPKRFSVEIRR